MEPSIDADEAGEMKTPATTGGVEQKKRKKAERRQKVESEGILKTSQARSGATAATRPKPARGQAKLTASHAHSRQEPSKRTAKDPASTRNQLSPREGESNLDRQHQKALARSPDCFSEKGLIRQDISRLLRHRISLLLYPKCLFLCTLFI